jgi:hypothetical protein
MSCRGIATIDRRQRKSPAYHRADSFFIYRRAVAEANGNTKHMNRMNIISVNLRPSKSPIFRTNTVPVQTGAREMVLPSRCKHVPGILAPVQTCTIVTVLAPPYLTFCKNEARLLKKARASASIKKASHSLGLFQPVSCSFFNFAVPNRKAKAGGSI